MWKRIQLTSSSGFLFSFIAAPRPVATLKLRRAYTMVWSPKYSAVMGITGMRGAMLPFFLPSCAVAGLKRAADGLSREPRCCNNQSRARALN